MSEYRNAHAFGKGIHLQRTLLIIKPDAVAKNKIGEILRRVEEKGFRIVDLYKRRLTRKEAETFYAEHRGKPFFEPLVDFMTEGPCIPVVLEGENIIPQLRKLVGKTDPADAAQGTIRRDLAENGRRNAVHASDSPETAEREIAFFFDGKREII
ncbi:MAG TPA: nucleoside-diphosphate kinase [bacterium]|nr:nucleoside-diphosphate kinase [bacterium]